MTERPTLYAANGSGTCADLHHRVEIPPDDGEPVVFHVR